MNHWKLASCLITLSSTLIGTADAADVAISQLNWLDVEGEVAIPASRVGAATFTLDPADPQHQLFLEDNGGGFINLSLLNPATDELEWVVRNLYLSYPNPEHLAGSTPSVRFGLPVQNGQPLQFAMYGLSISPDPLEGLPDDQQFGKTPVPLIDHRNGGLIRGETFGGSPMSTLPFSIGPWILPPVFPILHSSIAVPVNQIETVNEWYDHCFPGAVARSIRYLAGIHGFQADPAQQIHDDLAAKMGTQKVIGTELMNGLNGKISYTQQKDLPINTRHVPDNVHEPTAPPPTKQQMLEVLADLNNNCDVEMHVGWTGGGGHTVMVTSMTKMSDGSYVIRYVEDFIQGLPFNLNWEEVIRIAPNGSFDAGVLWGFMVECVKHPNPADLNGDGVVDVQDLLILFNNWGDCDDPDDCPADLNGDGVVDVQDLLIMFDNWG